jgi:hypothetical protein
MRTHPGDGQSGETCDLLSFDDPMDDMISAIRELAFRMSLQLARDNGTDAVLQHVPYTSRTVQVQYAVNTTSLVIAVLVSLAGPLAIFPLFWGWWHLGRKVSMSPLEAANAFYAGDGRANTTAQQGNLAHLAAEPAGRMFGSCSGNSSAGHIVKVLGRKGPYAGARVQYAVLPSGQLGMGSVMSAKM